MSETGPRVAIVGATGAVGSTLLELITDRGFRYSGLSLVASARSAGRQVEYQGRTLPVHRLEDFDFHGIDVAFFSAGTSISAAWAPVAVAAGALVIDNTNAFRMDPDSPLVVPQVNGELLVRRPLSGIIGNPNCSTIPLVRLLAPVHQRWRLRSVVVSTYQAASGQGLRGISELRSATRHALDPESVPPTEPDRFARSLAFDVLPSIDRPLPSGFTLEEQKMTQESRKILNLPTLDLNATCVRVPVINCHSEAVYVRCDSEVSRDELMDVLAAQPEVEVYRGDFDFPTPATVKDRDRVHVGRIRVAQDEPNAFLLWLVADNIRVGAALNAIQIAERLSVEGVL